MPRRPDLPCASCGEMMWRSATSLPEGQARCRKCRYANTAHGTRRRYREHGCRCDECRAWANAQSRAYNASRRERTGESYWQSIKPAKQRTTTGECTKCGKAMDRVRTASPLCAPCRGNRPGYNIRVSAESRLAIYERDGWICQICTEPVDPAAPANTTWDATLDHIVPRSKGGDDSPANLRLAHRWCNSVRGDLSHHPDDVLRVA